MYIYDIEMKKEALRNIKDYEDGLRVREKYKDGLYNKDITVAEKMRYYMAKKFIKENYSRYCMNDYKFKSEMLTKGYNDKLNRFNIVDLVLDKQYDMTNSFNRDIVNPVRNENFAVFGIVGEPGSGKSELAQYIAFRSQWANKRYMKRDVKIHLVWTQSDLNNLMPDLKKGDIIWKDEMPKTFREGANIEKWQIENNLRIMRKFSNTLIFIDPNEIKYDICNIHLEASGMNLKTRTNRFLVLYKDNMSNKYNYVGHLYAKLHDDEDYRANYEIIKNKFIEHMFKISGDLRVKKQEKVIEHEKIDADKPLIENDLLNDKTLYKYSCTEEDLFKIIKKEVKWHHIERDFEIFEVKRATGRLSEDIGEEYNLTADSINKICAKVKASIRYYKGIIFEKDYKKYIETLNVYDKVIREGGPRQADLYAYIEKFNTMHILSLKCYYIEKRPKTFKPRDFKPELEKAYKEHVDGKYREIKLYAVIFDTNIDKLDIIEMDYLKPEIITLR
jgi:hypothetical protein